MKRTFAPVLAWFALGAAATVASAAQPLLTPTELQALQSRPASSAAAPAAAVVRVIDVRDAKSYAANHIAQAVNAPYAQWRGPASNPGDPPAPAQLTQLVQSLGLTASTHAVVVSSGADTTDFGAAARVYWTLKMLGVKDLSILNGGMQAWAGAALPQTTQVPAVAASTFQPVPDARLLATRAEVQQHVALNNAALVDSRPDDFYLGKKRAPAAQRAGTLPGAQQLDFNQWFVPGTSTFVDTDTARRIAAQVKRKEDQETVAFCNTGHWAATDWFGLSEVAGLPNVSLYAGSMADWTQDAAAQVTVHYQPSRAQQLADSAAGWWQRVRN